MLEKLDFMMRFWDLKARHGSLGAPLSAAERVELLSLLNLLATDDPLPSAGPPPSSRAALAARITRGAGFVAVEVRVVCAQGVVCACRSPLAVGQSTVLRIADEAAAVDYALPCVVEWAHLAAPSAMALRVDGVPARGGVVETEALAWAAATGWALERVALAG
jgi:hypothetical protein